MSKGIIHLIPNLLSDVDSELSIPKGVISVVSRLKFFLVENEKVARRYLKKLESSIIIDELTFFSMGKHAESESLDLSIQAVKNGNDLGVISDAGCPGVADPGSLIVERAHSEKIKIIPYVGPSSILLTLMASGLNGQNFTFHGYLPIDKKERAVYLRSISQAIARDQSTHLFMDTPFRNLNLYEDVLRNCPAGHRLCIARDVTGDQEWIRTMSIADWKNQKPEINKIPVMFALGH